MTFSNNRISRIAKNIPNCQLLERDLIDSEFDTESLVELLKHKDAKVRTLAMAALFDKEDPQVLPTIVTLADDAEDTFPAPKSLGSAMVLGPQQYDEKPQTVGEICTRMVNYYLHPAGYAYGISGSKKHPGFEHYWKSRKNREDCASWLLVRLYRASGGGINPLPEHRLASVQEIRRQIDTLPGMDAPLTLLWVACRRTEWDDRGGGDATSGVRKMATRADLLNACRHLGRERLIQILNRQPPTDDPDLQPRSSGNWFYKRMSLFILRNATELFDAEDSSTILVAEAEEGKYLEKRIGDPTLTAFWATGAASLQPQDAHRILHDAYARFGGEFDGDERSNLSVALWNLCGSNETEFIVNQFYTENPRRGTFPHSRAYFLQQLASTNDRSIFTALINDNRFEQLDWQSVKTFAKVVNSWLDVPVIDPQDLQDTWGPFGEGSYHWMRDEARKKDPKETENLESALTRWRTEMRKSISRWHLSN